MTQIAPDNQLLSAVQALYQPIAEEMTQVEAILRAEMSSDGAGVPPDGREALVFAVLGARCLAGEPSTRPGATGAREGRVLGKLCWPAATGGASA